MRKWKEVRDAKIVHGVLRRLAYTFTIIGFALGLLTAWASMSAAHLLNILKRLGY